MDVPDGVRWLESRPSGAAWLRALPALVAVLADRWSLRLGRPYPDSHVCFACPAERDDGTAAVLKVQWPHLESDHEAAALQAWDGRGYVRLIDHDAADHALLLERCEPGTPLTMVDHEAALDAYASLLREQWVTPATTAPFVTLAEQARGWVDQLGDRWEAAGRPFERALLDAAAGLVDDLAPSQPDAVLVNLDLHPGNVLSSRRRAWLAIDPKPVIGERAASLSPAIRSFELGHAATAVAHRLDRLSQEVEVDRDRARGWAIVQAVAWSLEGPRVFSRHLDTARWLLSVPPGR